MSAPRPTARTVAIVMSCLLITACSRSTDRITSPRPTTTISATTAPDSTVSASNSTAPDPAATAPTPSAPVATLPPPEPPITVVDVAEVGVPGLDSDDAFCASWSRFAGSFQVVAVTAAFGSGSADDVAALEVAAAPTVTSAYDQLVSDWPDTLSSEAALVADDFLGPFARRLDVARQALVDVGADAPTIDAIAEAWLAALAQRDPTTPEFVLDLPDEIWAVIDDAAAAFGAQRVDFGSDPSLVTNVATPLTDEFLAVSCPDQGTLSGQEVESP